MRGLDGSQHDAVSVLCKSLWSLEAKNAVDSALFPCRGKESKAPQTKETSGELNDIKCILVSFFCI